MKVYIVTSGCYSDYMIERVFLDKEKAEKYAKLHKGWGAEVEEYETSDDVEIEELTYVDVHYYENVPYAKNGVHFEIRKSNSLDTDVKDLKSNYLFHYDEERLNFSIKRPIFGNYDEDYLKNKYTKVCYDLAFRIKHLVEVEGWSTDMVKAWFSNELDEFLD